MKVEVLLPKVFNFSFTYNSNSISLKIGDLVEIPFGKNKEIGVVWKNKNTEINKNIIIKNISKKIKGYSLDQKIVNFVEWFSLYNMVPLGLALKMVIGNKDDFIKKVNESFEEIIKKKKTTNLITNKKKLLNI